MAEIMPRAYAQRGQHVEEGALLGFVVAGGFAGAQGVAVAVQRGGAGPEEDLRHIVQTAADLGGRQHQVHRAGAYGGTRHVAVLAVSGRLHQGESAEFLDLGQAQRTVAAGARQQDADGALALRFGQAAEEQVEGRRLLACIGRGGLDMAALEHQAGIRRDQIKMAAAQRLAPGELLHLERGGALQDFHCIVLALRIHSQGNDDGDVPGAEVFQQLGQRGQCAGRAADSDHQRLFPGWHPVAPLVLAGSAGTGIAGHDRVSRYDNGR
ncbi:hypothetical protein NM961_04190 [Tahibacter sp. P2K]|uniref:Uncharacterized protein n=1 Tax=Tahibacter harae TaxID=2963937 RepID=A0ABT1QMZ8_9GAMM|nr:hypothetical protein [Tahibacter harae]MCQ4163904.1 hypothetical protein [Tahibacter harae]